jgi:hypothetical protein
MGRFWWQNTFPVTPSPSEISAQKKELGFSIDDINNAKSKVFLSLAYTPGRQPEARVGGHEQYLKFRPEMIGGHTQSVRKFEAPHF